jgi:hypothetical protein
MMILIVSAKILALFHEKVLVVLKYFEEISTIAAYLCLTTTLYTKTHVLAL